MAGTAYYARQDLDLKGGQKITSTGEISVITSGSAHSIGRGFYIAKVAIRSIEVASGDEGYTIDLVANTRSASTSWFTIPLGNVGDLAVTGRSVDDSASQPGILYTAFYCPYDYQIKSRVGVVGTVASGIDLTITIYPAEQAF
jgi:hypothetical protein